MKKMLAVLVALLVFATFTTCGFAAGQKKASAGVIKGEVVSIDQSKTDPAKKDVSIKTKSGEIKTVSADPTIIPPTLKLNEDKVKVVLKAGESNVAESITIIPPKKAKPSKK